MRKGILGMALVALLALVRAEPAGASLVFTFSFNNALNGGGHVTGVISGLNEGTGAASSVEVTSNSAGFGVAEYAPTAAINSWTVTGGLITDYKFFSLGNVNPATDATLFFDASSFNGLSFRAGLSNTPHSVVLGNDNVDSSDIGLAIGASAGPSAEVPLPATLPLLVAGLAGLAYLRRRKA